MEGVAGLWPLDQEDEESLWETPEKMAEWCDRTQDIHFEDVCTSNIWWDDYIKEQRACRRMDINIVQHLGQQVQARQVFAE